MQLTAFSPDLVIITVLLAGGAYGLLGGKHRLRLLILSIYVGIVLADQMTGVVHPLVGGLSSDQVTWLLLGLPIILFGFTRGHHGRAHEDKGSMIANILVGLGAGALILSSALNLMATSSQHDIDQDSFLALQLGQYHLWLLGLLPLVAFVLGLFRAKERHH
jgi:hypothetical protein